MTVKIIHYQKFSSYTEFAHKLSNAHQDCLNRNLRIYKTLLHK